jgi:hypothetical protein
VTLDEGDHRFDRQSHSALLTHSFSVCAEQSIVLATETTTAQRYE